MAKERFYILMAILLMEGAFANENIRLHEGDWSIDANLTDVDETEYGREQFRDLTDWQNIDANEWTDLTQWKKQRVEKDKTSNWRTLVRNVRSSEPIGKVIKCAGKCKNFKGSFSSSAKTLTSIREGDEFQTDANSAAWITLIDGTILRISPNTSITFNEVNLSSTEVFFLIRINYGHFQFQPRLRGEFAPQDRPETDMAFYPLLIKEANREYYSIQEYSKFDQQEKFQYLVTSNAGYVSQYQSLNKFLSQNEDVSEKRDTKLFIYSANISLITKNVSGAIYYRPRGDARIKLTKKIDGFVSSDKRSQSGHFQLRGYETRPVKEVTFDTWLKVDPTGTKLEKSNKKERHLNTAEAFLKRIPTIQVARELFLAKYFAPMLDPKLNSNQLAKDFGVRLWNSGERPEMYLREIYLKEYIRRTETTNLKSLAILIPEINHDEFDITYIEDAMKTHYAKLKQLYTKKYMSVREMTENEYYLWLIRNEK